MHAQLTTKEIETNLEILPLFDKQIAKDIPEIAKKDFENKIGNTHLIYLNGKRVLLLGLGEKNKFNPQAWRIAIHSALQIAKSLKAEQISLELPAIGNNKLPEFLELTGFALTFSAYEFDEYKTEKAKSIKDVFIIAKNATKRLSSALEGGMVIGRAANSAKDLANHPGNIATPRHLANHAQKIAKQFNFSCKILGPTEIAKEKLGLIQAVAKGSNEPAKLIILEYGKNQKQPIVLVGKGLTFDSGGISLKPADKMEEMKYDMAGGAVVIGIFEAAAKLKLPIHIVGIIPSTENLVSGSALKPGDIVKSHLGKTVEVINTDAEGRMVLGDAISYAKKHFNPSLILDYATLTGAVAIALGDQYTGMVTNTKKYSKELLQASAKTAEKFWELPLADEYRDQTKSQIADIKNIGDRGGAGVITGALFLEHFAGSTPWIHFDTGATAWLTSPKPQGSIGATSWGVYLGIDFLRRIKA